VLEDKSTPTDALEEWLNSPIVNTQQDPIAYWTGMQAVGHALARMALNFLSTPSKSLALWFIHCFLILFFSKLN